MIDLNDATAQVQGYKTRKGAEKKLAMVATCDFLGFVFGTFIPVAVLNANNMYLAGGLAFSGIYVTDGSRAR